MDQETLHISKQCPTCGKVFTLEDLLSDPDLVPIGMTSDEEDNPESLYYFTHEVPGCGTTFTIPANVFRPAITESVPGENLRGHVDCPGYCTRVSEFRACKNNCHWSPYRRLLLDMVERRKAARARTR